VSLKPDPLLVIDQFHKQESRSIILVSDKECSITLSDSDSEAGSDSVGRAPFLVIQPAPEVNAPLRRRCCWCPVSHPLDGLGPILPGERVSDGMCGPAEALVMASLDALEAA